MWRDAEGRHPTVTPEAPRRLWALLLGFGCRWSCEGFTHAYFGEGWRGQGILSKAELEAAARLSLWLDFDLKAFDGFCVCLAHDSWVGGNRSLETSSAAPLVSLDLSHRPASPRGPPPKKTKIHSFNSPFPHDPSFSAPNEPSFSCPNDLCFSSFPEFEPRASASIRISRFCTHAHTHTRACATHTHTHTHTHTQQSSPRVLGHWPVAEDTRGRP